MATNPKSWKRLSKIDHTNPLFCDYIGKTFEIQTRDGSGNITSEYKSPEGFKTERVFECSTDKLDSSLRYVVVEDFQGNLFLANEIGD